MAKDNEFLIPLEGGDEKKKPYLSISTSYLKGRGYFLHVSPIRVEETDNPNVSIRSFMLFSGAKQFIEPTKRLSRKRERVLFEEAVADYKAKQGSAYALVLHVLEEEGLKLKEEKTPLQKSAEEALELARLQVPCT